MGGDREETLRHFRRAFSENPTNAYRDWFRLQEELRESGDAGLARALADDFWSLSPSLNLPSDEDRARFFHNTAVFFGTPGPAANLARAREAFEIALAHFSAHDDAGWHARALHNYATSLSNLGETSKDLAESVALFDRALEWRTSEREIARGVTLHNLGMALRRLAELDAPGRVGHLDRSAACLEEACEIRLRHRLAEGRALSLFHLGLTLEALGRRDKAVRSFYGASEEFERLGKAESAAVARERAAAIER
ncbi:MAG TPA: hypothetical protein VKG01_03145 [Thermoanaerobaculia bacterium]|nr:hypothetical protein [Thermoanaerobaculia bacterium]